MTSLSSITNFFHDDPNVPYIPPPEHTLEQSPCCPIIVVRQGYFYCRLHPELGPNAGTERVSAIFDCDKDPSSAGWATNSKGQNPISEGIVIEASGVPPGGINSLQCNTFHNVDRRHYFPDNWTGDLEVLLTVYW